MFGTVVVTRLSSVIMIRFGNLRAVKLVLLWSWDCYSWLGICWLFVVELWSCPPLSNYITTMRYYGSYGWLNILCQFTDACEPSVGTHKRFLTTLVRGYTMASDDVLTLPPRYRRRSPLFCVQHCGDHFWWRVSSLFQWTCTTCLIEFVTRKRSCRCWLIHLPRACSK